MATTTTYNVFASETEGGITVAAGSNYSIQEMTIAQYNALPIKNANVLYVITEG